MLCSCFPLAIYFTFGSICKSKPLSHSGGQIFFFFLNFGFIYLFIYLSMAVLGLYLCARAPPSCGKRGPPPIAVRGPLTERPLPLRSTGSRRAGPVLVAHGPSCSAACGIPPDQGPNPCLPHRQADPQPLRHQGSPGGQIFNPSLFTDTYLASQILRIVGQAQVSTSSRSPLRSNFTYPGSFCVKSLQGGHSSHLHPLSWVSSYS